MNGNQPYQGQPGQMGPNTVYIGFDQPVNVAPHPQAAYGHQGYQTRQSHVNQANVEEGVYFKEKKKRNTFGLLGFLFGVVGLATGALPVALAGGGLSTIGVFRRRRFLAMVGLTMALLNPTTQHFFGHMTDKIARPDRHTSHVAQRMIEEKLAETNTALASAEDRVMGFYNDNQQTWPDDIQGNMLVAELSDAWGTSLRYDEMPDRLLVRSAGPDKKAETNDDIVVALQHFRKAVTE